MTAEKRPACQQHGAEPVSPTPSRVFAVRSKIAHKNELCIHVAFPTLDKIFVKLLRLRKVHRPYPRRVAMLWLIVCRRTELVELDRLSQRQNGKSHDTHHAVSEVDLS